MKADNFNLQNYFNLAHKVITSAALEHQDSINVAGHQVTLATHSQALRELFLPAVAHLACPPGTADLTILYADGSQLEQRLPAPPRQLTNNQGFAAGVNQDDYQFFYQPWSKQVFLYSRQQRLGLYWVLNPSEVPWWETTFSFRIIFHWWSRDNALQLMHAGAICHNQTEGWLVPGPSGSGKSTSCLNLLLNGAYYLGDDYVVVNTTPPYTVHSLYQTVKINADNFDIRFKALSHHLQNPAHYQQQKAVLLASTLAPKKVIHSAPLVGIAMPSLSNPPQQQSTINAVSAGKALLSIAPTTLHHLPHHRPLALHKISRLVNALPCFNWQLGHDSQGVIDSFKALAP